MSKWRPKDGVFTVDRVAEILGVEPRLVWIVSDDMREEDGVIDIHDVAEQSVRALTADAIELVEQMIEEMKRSKYVPANWNQR